VKNSRSVRVVLSAAILLGLSPSWGLSLFAAGAAQDVAVTVKDVEPFPYCAVSHKGPYTDMTAVIGELIGAMQTQGLFPQVRGPMVGVYHNWPGNTKPADLSWEAGFIIGAQATPQPPLVKKVWEHKTVAVALHVGPYDKCGAAVEKVMAWLAAQGYETDGPILERYLDMNPMAVKPADLRTEIWVPCKKK
jgi:effector-binding domain-containing protein